MKRATLSAEHASSLLDEWLLELFLIAGVMVAVGYGFAGLGGAI